MASEVLRLDTAKLKHERVFLSILIPYFQTLAEFARSYGEEEVADMIDKYKVRSGIECGVSVCIFFVFVTFLSLPIRVLFSSLPSFCCHFLILFFLVFTFFFSFFYSCSYSCTCSCFSFSCLILPSFCCHFHSAAQSSLSFSCFCFCSCS